jgi:hypothetical protein
MSNRQIKQTLCIAPTSQRCNEIKKEYATAHKFIKTLTLSQLQNEIFEIVDEQNLLLDLEVAVGIIYKLINESKNNYFKYLSLESESLYLIYDFFIKLGTNEVDITQFQYKKAKEDTLKELYLEYCEYKKENNLVDRADILDLSLLHVKEYLQTFSQIHVDDFQVGGVRLVQSKKEKLLLEAIKNNGGKTLQYSTKSDSAKLYQNSAFDAYDEMRVAIKISKKLLLDGARAKDILIVTNALSEYAPYFYNLLDEYGMKGYDTKGVALSSISLDENRLKHHSDMKVQNSYWEYKTQYTKTLQHLNYLKLSFNN